MMYETLRKPNGTLGDFLLPSRCLDYWPALALCRPLLSRSHAARRGSRSPTGCTCSGTSPPWTRPRAVCTCPAAPGQFLVHFQTGPFLKSPSKGREIVNAHKGHFNFSLSNQSTVIFPRILSCSSPSHWERGEIGRPVNYCETCK